MPQPLQGGLWIAHERKMTVLDTLRTPHSRKAERADCIFSCSMGKAWPVLKEFTPRTESGVSRPNLFQMIPEETTSQHLTLSTFAEFLTE